MITDIKCGLSLQVTQDSITANKRLRIKRMVRNLL